MVFFHFEEVSSIAKEVLEEEWSCDLIMLNKFLRKKLESQKIRIKLKSYDYS